jgi:hypothetical protein
MKKQNRLPKNESTNWIPTIKVIYQIQSYFTMLIFKILNVIEILEQKKQILQNKKKIEFFDMKLRETVV